MAESPGFTARDALDLLDWKRQVFDLYKRVRTSADAPRAWRDWCETRERLIRTHPQSPVAAEVREAFALSVYDYDPRWRVIATVADLPAEQLEVAASTGVALPFSRVGVARFGLEAAEHELEIAWNEAYGGGVFIAFTDETTGQATYGGGRYVVDTVKGADLGPGGGADTLVLDFNFAYHPSCSYDGRWACPLAPPANRLPVAVTAGERTA